MFKVFFSAALIHTQGGQKTLSFVQKSLKKLEFSILVFQQY